MFWSTLDQKNMRGADYINVSSNGEDKSGIEMELLHFPEEGRFDGSVDCHRIESFDIREAPTSTDHYVEMKVSHSSYLLPKVPSIGIFSKSSSEAVFSPANAFKQEEPNIAVSRKDSKKKKRIWKRFYKKQTSSQTISEETQAFVEPCEIVEEENHSKLFMLGIHETSIQDDHDHMEGFETDVIALLSPAEESAGTARQEKIPVTSHTSSIPSGTQRHGLVTSILQRGNIDLSIQSNQSDTSGVFPVTVTADELIKSGQLEIGHETDMITVRPTGDRQFSSISTGKDPLHSSSHQLIFGFNEIASVVRDNSLTLKESIHRSDETEGSTADNILKDIQAFQIAASRQMRKPPPIHVDFDKTPKARATSIFEPRIVTEPVDPTYRQMDSLLSPDNFHDEPNDFADFRKPSMPAEVKFPDICNEDDEDLVTLFTACEIGNRDLVKRQIIEKPQVITRNKDGRTPLFYAARAGRVSIVKLLLAAGARDENGECLNVAKDDKIRKLLLKSHERSTLVGINRGYENNRHGGITPIIRKMRPQQILQMVKKNKIRKASDPSSKPIRNKGSGISDLTSRSSSVAESLLDDDDDENTLPILAAEQIVRAAKYAMATGDEASIFKNPKLTSDEREAARQVMLFLQQSQHLLLSPY